MSLAGSATPSGPAYRGLAIPETAPRHPSSSPFGDRLGGLDPYATIIAVFGRLPHVVPMLATLVPEPFHRDGWVYEEKVDGWRIVAHKDGSHVWLVSRTARDHAGRFPEIAAAMRRLPAPTLVLDGAVAVFDERLDEWFHYALAIEQPIARR